MGFSRQITIENQTGSGANTLTNRGNLPALSTIAANTDSTFPQIRLNQTLNEAVTAYLLGAELYSTTINGGVIFVTNQNSIFSFEAATTSPNVFPFKLYLSPSEYNSIGYRLSATGQECASGVQVCAVVWTLSSTALSATSAGNVIPITVSNGGVTSDVPSVSSVTQVFCINTPIYGSDGVVRFVCQADLSRFVQSYMG
jgi:hypothetical protein